MASNKVNQRRKLENIAFFPLLDFLRSICKKPCQMLFFSWLQRQETVSSEEIFVSKNSNVFLRSYRSHL